MTDDVKTDAVPATKELPAVYTSGSIGVAAFLGGPIAACWFIKKNYEALGEAQKGRSIYVWSWRLTALVGVAITVVLTLLQIKMNDVGSIIPIAYTAALAQMCRRELDDKLRQRVASGAARTGSTGKLLLYSVGWLAVTLAYVFVLDMTALTIMNVAHLAPLEPPK
jgi:hypothetical protein